MKISARNTLKGVVKRVEQGVVNAEIAVELPGDIEVVSIITKKSMADLGLSVGKSACAVIKASRVMLAVDH